MSDTKNQTQDERKEQNLSSVQAFGEEPDPSANRRTSDEIYTGQQYKASSKEAEKKKDSIAKDISILVVITLVAGCLLGVAYGVTKNPIAAAQAAAKAKAQKAVMSGADHFEPLYASDNTVQGGTDSISAQLVEAIQNTGLATTQIKQIDTAEDKDGKLLGYVITADDPDGYGGNIEVMCGITPNDDGTVTLEGISFLTLKETAGMGMRAKDPEFQDQFSGKKLDEGELIIYTKSGARQENEIDAISGCTITTSAVTDDVNAALVAAWQLVKDGKEAKG